MVADVKPTYLRCEYLVEPLAVATDQPRLSWVIESGRRGTMQSAYQVLAATSEDILADHECDLWDSGKVASSQSCQVVYDGRPLSAGQDVYWKVRVWDERGEPSPWSPPAHLKAGLFSSSDWQAQWISPTRPIDENEILPARPSPMVRRAFELDRPIRRAICYASALGLYELHLNGQKVGQQRLTPEWTDYRTRVQYQAYDVTELLKKGDNAVGAILADGWYAGRLGISIVLKDEDTIRGFYGKRLAFLMQMEVEYADGGTETIVTDGQWKWSDDGPIRQACILDGEVYDARKQLAGWDNAGFDDGAWPAVAVHERVDLSLDAQPNEPILVTEELAPVAVNEPSPGVYVVDFGQNLAGVCRIQLDQPAGTQVRLRHAEVLEPDGNIYRDNLRMKPFGKHYGARQEDTYICAGGGDEVYEPRFTYHGFRYVEIVGLSKKPSPERIVARAFHSAPPMAGAFACSSDLLNQLMKNIVWTHRDNMHSVPTDCPQRDERMGWSGDMLVFAQPAGFNMDMAAFFGKWARDLRDDQADDGRFPDIAPNPYDSNKILSGVPAWGDVGVFVPWVSYVNYGDKRIVREQLDACCRWVDWIHTHNPDLLWKNNRGNDYGDWLNGDTLQLEGFPKGEAEVPKEVFATAFFQQSAELVSRMAEVVGEDAAANKYSQLADDIRKAFIEAYVKPDGTIEGHTQSVYALALHFDLVPDELRAAAAEHMARRIADYKNHISTGFHTTIMLMNELTACGRSDLAYMLINNRTIPSWGYTIDQGATTIWERWDGYVEGRGYQDANMNSFCHYAIGSVGEWMYRSILGINPDPERPAYEHIIIRPRIGGGLQWARGHYDSIRGRIASAWKVEEDGLSLEVTVPANAVATVYVPGEDAARMTENGRPLAQADGIQVVGQVPGEAVIVEVGSGTYRFHVGQ